MTPQPLKSKRCLSLSLSFSLSLSLRRGYRPSLAAPAARGRRESRGSNWGAEDGEWGGRVGRAPSRPARAPATPP